VRAPGLQRGGFTEVIGSGAGDCAPAPSHTTVRAVFRIRRLDYYASGLQKSQNWLPDTPNACGGFSAPAPVCQSRVVTVVVALCCFVCSFRLHSRLRRLAPSSFGPSLETPFGSCVPQTLLWPLLTSRSLSTPGSPRVSVCSFRSRLWALQNAVSDSWASWSLAHSPPTSCLSAHLCSFGRTLASRPFAPPPRGDSLAVRLRLASQAPVGNLSSR